MATDDGIGDSPGTNNSPDGSPALSLETTIGLKAAVGARAVLRVPFDGRAVFAPVSARAAIDSRAVFRAGVNRKAVCVAAVGLAAANRLWGCS